MLVIDDNKLKLVKMHEALLKVSTPNKNEILKKYRELVSEIDSQAFSDILREIEQISEHNQSLEDELQFLERIKGSYDQLLELQFSFRRTYELYGSDELKLSDLSQLNISYIEDRINVINGYLINLKNIDENKNRLRMLSEQLVEEEKKKDALSKRLLESECSLRESFLGAEGRDIQLQPVSVMSEYQKIDIDFRRLLTDSEALDSLLSSLNRERVEYEEKLKTAEICYNSSPSADSKQILRDIERDFLDVKYRLAMVKIIELLAQNYDSYDLCKEKRENIQRLIKYRLIWLEKLGIRFSVDPFSRTKINEQVQLFETLSDNSKNVNRIRKEIAQLDSRTEEMVNQNSQYLVSLSDTKALLENRTSMNDIDISSIDLGFNIADVPVVKPVMDNQVVSVKVIPFQFNMRIAKEKTSGVLRRVCGMVQEKHVVSREDSVAVVPELVIGPKIVYKDKSESKVDNKVDTTDNLVSDVKPPLQVFSNVDVSFDNLIDDEDDDLVLSEQDDEEPEVNQNVVTSDIFATVVPFTEPSMFTDRTDESTQVLAGPVSESLTSADLVAISEQKDPELELHYGDSEDEMPDAFWVTDEDDTKKESEVEVISFEDQINALIMDGQTDVNGGFSRSRKKAA